MLIKDFCAREIRLNREKNQTDEIKSVLLPCTYLHTFYSLYASDLTLVQGKRSFECSGKPEPEI